MMTKMMMKFLKKITILPIPVNINMWWNMGSLIGISLLCQIITGFILSMNYCPNSSMAFDSIIQINNNVNTGWMVRSLHINGASMYFLTMYIHLLRNLYNLSYTMKSTWSLGMMILMMSMMTAFMGYILPWGQMSYWGATVITNLISVIPLIGMTCVEWVWGGFSVSNPTLNRFFSMHFMVPLMVMMMIMGHVSTLHWSGSSNPMGLKSLSYMIPFHPYFTIKDLLGAMIMILIILLISTLMPDMMTDPDNFLEANPLSTPTHIKPEWYFLPPYAILRSVPSKLGGVICLMASIMMFMMMMTFPDPLMKSMKFYPILPSLFWMFVNLNYTLMWLGSKPLEYPFIILSQIMSFSYFLFFLIVNIVIMKYRNN